MIYPELAKKHPTFTYLKHQFGLEETGLVVRYLYAIGPDYQFTHTVTFNNVTETQLKTLSDQQLDQYLFTIGLSEMLSYWKLAASPTIHINAGALTQTQLDWWKKLLLKGMGEYFYVNKLPFTTPNFVTVNTLTLNPDKPLTTYKPQESDHYKLLVPLGGGKDSAVTIAVLQGEPSFEIGALMVNPLPSAQAVALAGEVANLHTITRTFDPKLFELNAQGYLNGHVPVSASIACMSILVAKLHGYTHVAIANERSSNEGNIEYLGQTINHQYSKTFEFEYDLACYAATYLSVDTPQYVSFVRPLFELQIASIFARFPKYHGLFRSCNRGQKTNTWCGECPKCLFAYIILLPFLGPAVTAQHIGTDMLHNLQLLPLAKELLGVGPIKPLECVGTHEETMVAFHLCVTKYQEAGQSLPPLLSSVHTEVLSHHSNLPQRAQALFDSWNTQHLLPKSLETSLERAYGTSRTTFGI